MITKEANALTKKWLKEKGFKSITLKGWSPASTHIYPMDGFNVFITFHKDLYCYRYLFDVGFLFDGLEHGYGIINVRNLPSNKNPEEREQGIFYHYLDEEQYLSCLDEMYDKYLKPYFEQGKKYLKKVAKRGHKLFKDQRDYSYMIAGDARQKLKLMFGLHLCLGRF